MQSVDNYAASFEQPDSDESSSHKKSKKKKKKHEKDGEHHKHKKSKHKKERRSSSKYDSGGRHESINSVSAGNRRSSGSRRNSLNEMQSLLLPGCSLTQAIPHHYSPTTLWPVTAAPGGGFHIVPSNTSSPLSLPGVSGNIEGTFKYLSNQSPLGTPLALGVNPLLQNVQIRSNTPPISPAGYLQIHTIGTVPKTNSFNISNNHSQSEQSPRGEKRIKYHSSQVNNIPLSRAPNSNYISSIQTSTRTENNFHAVDHDKKPEYFDKKRTHEIDPLGKAKLHGDEHLRQQQPPSKFPDRGFGAQLQHSQPDGQNQQTEHKQATTDTVQNDFKTIDSSKDGSAEKTNEVNKNENVHPSSDQSVNLNINQVRYQNPSVSQGELTRPPLQSPMQDPPNSFLKRSDQTNPTRLPPPNTMRLQADQIRHHPPDQIRHPLPDQIQFLSPDQMRYPPPDQMRFPPPDIRHPPPNFLPPDQMRMPKSDYMRGLPPDHIRFPNPEQMLNQPLPPHMRNPPPGHFRSPPPDFTRNPMTGQPRMNDPMRGPPPFAHAPPGRFTRPPGPSQFPPNSFGHQQPPPNAPFHLPPGQFPPTNYQQPPPNFLPAPNTSQPPPHFNRPNFAPPPLAGVHGPPAENFQQPSMGMPRNPFPVNQQPDFSKPPPNFLGSSQLAAHQHPPGQQTDHSPYPQNNQAPTTQYYRPNTDNPTYPSADYKHQSLNSPYGSINSKANTLGSADYTKIVQALETLKSGKHGDKNSVLETEPISPPSEEKEKDKEKKRKKEKKHKKEKKKKKEKNSEEEEEQIKKRLQEKLAELATLNNADTTLSNSGLSIQLKSQPSKFNLKIESPVMKGNVFQKYKAAQLFRNESFVFPSKHSDHADRKYRKVTESGKDEDNGNETNDEGESNLSKDNAEDDIKTKEDLLKMLGIAEPHQKSQKQESAVLHSGSEDGEVLSDDELEERKKIKELIQKAKEEALASDSPVSRSFNKGLPGETVDNEVVKKDGDAESSDGEISTDGELSDDSVDEFGRLKKLRTEVSDNEDNDEKYRQKGYSSGSDSSDNSDEERIRWERSTEQAENRSPGPDDTTPEAILPTSVGEEEESEQKLTPEKTAEEFAKEQEEMEKERIEKEQQAEEQKRLRLEVMKLEGSINKDLVNKRVPAKKADVESSASESSEDEDNHGEEKIEHPNNEKDFVNHQDKVVTSSFHEKEDLKRILMEKLSQKQKQASPTKESSQVLVQEGGEDVNDAEAKPAETDYVDIFADSGDEEIKHDLKMEVEQIAETMEFEKGVGESKESTNQSNNATVTEQEVNDKQADVEVSSKHQHEVTLETLSKIRNDMGNMTKEELEEALKQLPSMASDGSLANDGRLTPVHLRDIEIPLKSLTDYVQDKRGLYKQCFRNVNKKEFKFMLPKYLRKFELKTVRNWCLDEIEIMSKKRLKAILLQQTLASSSSESEEEETSSMNEKTTDANKPVEEKPLEQKTTEAEKTVGVKAEETTTDKKTKKKNKKNKEKIKKGKKKKKKAGGECEKEEKSGQEESKIKTEEPMITDQAEVEKMEGGEESKVECKKETPETEASNDLNSVKDATDENTTELKDDDEQLEEIKNDEGDDVQASELNDQSTTVEGDVQNENELVKESDVDRAENAGEQKDVVVLSDVKKEYGDEGEVDEDANPSDAQKADEGAAEKDNETTLVHTDDAENIDVNVKRESVDEQLEVEVKEQNNTVTEAATDETNVGSSSDSSSDDEDESESKSEESGEESSVSDAKKTSVSDSDGLENISSLDEKDLHKTSDEEDEKNDDNDEEASDNDDDDDDDDEEEDDDEDQSESADDESSDSDTKSRKSKDKRDKKKEKRSKSSSSESAESGDSDEQEDSHQSRRGRARRDSDRHHRRDKVDTKERQERTKHDRDVREKDKHEREKYTAHEREKRRREKQKKLKEIQKSKRHHKKTEEESSEGESDEEEAEENEEEQLRKRRIKRYYLEKERRKRERHKDDSDDRGKRDWKHGKKDGSSSSTSEQSSDGSSSESNDDDDDDDTAYRKQMKVSSSSKKTMVSAEEHRDFMKYLAMKRKRQQEKKDLRRTFDDNSNNANTNANNTNMNRYDNFGNPAQTGNRRVIAPSNRKKPEGYEERKRLRELEKRRSMIPTPDSRRPTDNRPASGERRNNYNEQKFDYAARVGRRSRSSSDGTRTDRKHSRESSEIRHAKDGSDIRRSRELAKRKSQRTRSNSRDSSYVENKRRKRRSFSNEGLKPPSHLKELEFRARALQSLLNKKEESNNKALRRVHR